MNQPGELPIPAGRLTWVKRQAFMFPWYGRANPSSFSRLQTTAILEPGRPTLIICTYDVGYHASGWWANHEYDACLHLSISHIGEGTEIVHNPQTGDLTERQKIEAPSDPEVRAWAVAFFGAEHAPKAWLEPPAGSLDPHRLPGIAHVRLFYDQTTRQPIMPTGEVYDLKPWAESPAKILEGRLGADVR